MQFIEQFDFLTGVNPTIKLVVYVLIFIHIAAVGIWCILACPSMFKSSDNFSDRVEKALKENKAKRQ